MGCGGNAQSGEAIYAGKLKLFDYNDNRMDLYVGEPAPDDNEWKNHGFAIGVKILDDGDSTMRAENVLIDAKLDWCATFTGHDGSNVYEDGRGWLNWSTGIVDTITDDEGQWCCTRTNADGETYFLFGAGDYDNPDKYINEGDMISTIAQYKLRIRRSRQEPIHASCWGVFIKSQYQHFYNNGVPGVYDMSYSGIGEWSEGAAASSMSFQAEDGVTVALSVEDFTPPQRDVQDRVDVCPEWTPGVVQSASAVESGGADFYTLNDNYWLQLCYDGYYDYWYWIDAQPWSYAAMNFGANESPWLNDEPMPTSDPNSPNLWLQTIVDTSQPVCHFLDVNFTEPAPPDRATAVLRVLEHEPGWWPDPNYWPADHPGRKLDLSDDGVINMADFGLMSQYWLNDDPNGIRYDIEDLVGLSGIWLEDNKAFVGRPDLDGVLYSRIFYYATSATADDGARHSLSTPFIVFVDDQRFEGWYLDSWHNPVYAAWVPAGCVVDIRPVVDGDYNGDGVTNLLDYAYFARHWQASTYDPALDYDVDGNVTESDFKDWNVSWLKR